MKPPTLWKTINKGIRIDSNVKQGKGIDIMLIPTSKSKSSCKHYVSRSCATIKPFPASQQKYRYIHINLQKTISDLVKSLCFPNFSSSASINLGNDVLNSCLQRNLIETVVNSWGKTKTLWIRLEILVNLLLKLKERLLANQSRKVFYKDDAK